MNLSGLGDRHFWRLTVFTGLGFAAGFGWLWFAELGELWLPQFLWGGLLSGGGTSLFYGLLIIVPLTLSAALRPPRPGSAEKSRDWRRGRAPHIIHAAAVVLALIALLQPGLSRIPTYISVASLALAGLLTGLYWLAALLSLAPRQALMALGLAAAAAGASLFSLSLVSPSGRAWLLVPALLLAWFMARELIVSLKLGDMYQQLAPAPKRLRGRPAQKANEPPPNPVPLALHTLLPAAFFLLALAQAVSGLGGGWPNPFLSLCLNMLGLVAALYFSAAETTAGSSGFRRPPLVLIAAALILEAFCLGLGWGWWPSFLLEGFFWGLALSGLAEAGPLKASGWRRAALVLGAIAFLGNAARLAAAWLGPEAAGPPGSLAPAAALMAAAIGWGWIFFRRRPEPKAAVPLTAEELMAILSVREREVAELVMNGLHNLGISDRLCIAEDTVRFHLKNIYQKSGLSGRAALTALGRRKKAGERKGSHGSANNA